MVKREVIKKIREFHHALSKEKIQIAKIILYGSQLSGKSHRDSDIDIAVVSPHFGKDRFKEGVKLLEVACKIDPRLEPIPISLKSYKNDTWIPLIYELREKGLELEV